MVFKVSGTANPLTNKSSAVAEMGVRDRNRRKLKSGALLYPFRWGRWVPV